MPSPANASRPSSPRWTWLLILAAGLLVGVLAWPALVHAPAPQPVAGARAPEDGAMGWVPVASAEASAAATGKPILYEFNAAWCGPCQMLKHDVFTDEAKARAIAGRVVPVSVVDRYREDGHNPPEVDALQQRFQIEAFPTLVVVSPATGRFEKSEGYRGADATVEWIARSAASVR